MTDKDFPQPEFRQPKFPNEARLVEDTKQLPWPDWTGEALRNEFRGIKNGESGPDYIVDDRNKASFRPDYWVIGRIMDNEDYGFMEYYLSTKELGTSDVQEATYEKEQNEYFKEVVDGYTDVLSIINWARVLDDAKRSGIPVEEHPEFADFSLEGFIVSKIADTRGVSEQINDDIQNRMILGSLEQDPTGVNLLQLRENVIRSRLIEEGENPDQHPWLVGFQYGKRRFEQLADYLLRHEDMVG